MFKKYATVLCLSSIVYLPQAQAATLVEYSLIEALAAIFNQLPEDDTVTDTPLRSVCVHAMNGRYLSLGSGFGSSETSEGLGFDLHFCLVPESEPKAKTAFEKLCTNKLKYDYVGFSGPNQVNSFYICTEPDPV